MKFDKKATGKKTLPVTNPLWGGSVVKVRAMKDNTQLQEELSNRLEEIELRFAHWMGRASLLGLVLLPLVPGSLALASIGTKFPTQLDIPIWLAWAIGGATALGIELLGLIAVRLALKMRRFNRRAVGLDVEAAPLAQGYAAAVLYVGTVLTLTMLLKIWPHAALYALLPMSLLGALADWIYALSSDQNEREQVLRRILADQQAALDRDIDTLTAQVAELTSRIVNMIDIGAHEAAVAAVNAELDKATAECQRLSTLVVKLSDGETVPQLPAPTSDDSDSDNRRLTKAERHAALLGRMRVIVKPDDIDMSALADEFGTSERTIRRDIDELVNEQRLSINGVVKVL